MNPVLREKLTQLYGKKINLKPRQLEEYQNLRLVRDLLSLPESLPVQVHHLKDKIQEKLENQVQNRIRKEIHLHIKEYHLMESKQFLQRLHGIQLGPPTQARSRL